MVLHFFWECLALQCDFKQVVADGSGAMTSQSASTSFSARVTVSDHGTGSDCDSEPSSKRARRSSSTSSGVLSASPFQVGVFVVHTPKIRKENYGKS